MSDNNKTSDKTNNNSNYVRIPPCPRDRNEFNLWKVQMLSIFDNNFLRDVVTKPFKNIEKERMSDDEYDDWIVKFRRLQDKASGIPGDERAKSRLWNYVTEIERNQKASRFIMDALDKAQLLLINHISKTNAHELWKGVNSLYGAVDTSETRHSVLRQLHNVKKERDESMIDYFARIKSKHYSQNTFEAYWPHVEDFIRWNRRGSAWRHPKDMGTPEVTAYLTHLAVNRHVSASTQNQVFLGQ
jgi:hypothetical protein